VAEERINILMVDDSPSNLLALESILRGPDRNLIPISSGKDALRYLLDNEAAVVLLDVYMPGIDGLETAQLIRGREKSRDTPIIFLTANTTGVRHLSRGYSLGAVDYIVKPVEPEILRSKVNVFVDLYRKNREIRRQAQLLQVQNAEIENTNLHRLKLLIQLGHDLVKEHDPQQVLAKFCRSSRILVQAETAAVGLLDKNQKVLAYFASNPSGETARCEVSPAIQQALDRVVAEQRPWRLTEGDLVGEGEAALEMPEVFLGAPIVSATGVCGWAYLLNKTDSDEFTEADERLAATLATQVGVAFENARLYTEAQKHATELGLEMAVRKQAEEERARLLVREQSARAEAELANRTKDEFLATLSHELRTPLTAILGWSHIVRQSKLDDTQLSRALETIERNAHAQSRLIDDLLDVSRIISGKLQIDLRVVDLATVIEAAVDAMRPALEAKHIDFEMELGSRAFPVMGDPNRLQQIFWNLFSNAAKFTPKRGQVRVAIESQVSSVCVSVSDSGIGIKPEFLPYIFDRFRQADGSTTRSQGGLGLGLAIVRHLVDLHQGKVEVESNGQHSGSTFIITLPIARPATNKAGAGETVLRAAGNGGARSNQDVLRGLRILVVDDEADSRELVATILMRSGGQVRCSDSAADALQAFKEWQPDLLISDLAMPNEDGFTLLRKLRKLRSKRAKEIPAVALSAYASDEDRAISLAKGFQMHLPKPIEPESLIISVATAVGRDGISVAAAARENGNDH
ncbi:MAG TPA: response regulator, partial [Pyrinomonadaceae bacterium]|nr:response regulator [Pyrinomonadaceae bacterium]